MDRRIIIIAGVVLVCLIGGGIFLFMARSGSNVAKDGATADIALSEQAVAASAAQAERNRIRENTLALARENIARGEFQRALDLLDRLLIEDFLDEEARILRNDALENARLAIERSEPPQGTTTEELAALLAAQTRLE